MSEWTATVISWRSPSGRSGGSSLAFRVEHEYGKSHWQTPTLGQVADSRVTEARPLVVIDPEDREQVERLWDAIMGVAGIGEMQEALREFADPKPPTCSAHGEAACAECSRITPKYLTADGGCTSCGVYEVTGMHWDTCPGRIKGRVFASRDEAMGVTL